MKFIFLTAALASLFSFNAAAECAGVSCTNVKITRIVTIAKGGVSVSTSGDESKLSCNAGSSGYIKLRPEDSNYNAVYSLLLTAHTTGHPIWIRTSESGECSLVYAVSDK
ncbi:hypothetical protein [Pseudoalteromonas luteoviolacea]|uniref:hypothetical protein n=1 Tax=Pseudoalteromonas luteoviolacea TaxID=43657 RepID=UPI001B373FCC|nr:hypothetical protein [Pseudoalteromonas luteoviolacea]MBQ4837221.1 hypothetical protein [Pseudoalteromonas luteoviolacea]